MVGSWSRWLAYIDTLPWVHGQLDESSHSAFLRAADLNVPQETAEAEVAARIAAAGDKPKAEKLSRQFRNACAYICKRHRAPALFSFRLPKAPKPQKPHFHFDPAVLQRFADRIPVPVTSEYLQARSRFTCSDLTPAGFLEKLYRPGEKIVVFNLFESQGCTVWEHCGAGQDLATLNWLQNGQPGGVWFLINPVDGRYHWNPREQRESLRSEEAVTSWRYAVLESDNAPPALWLKALVQLPLPIAAIYSSGGRSIHALVLVDAVSKEQWDLIIRKQTGPCLVSLGLCMKSLTAVRLSRLPNCMRAERGARQQLFYLNPDPAQSALYEAPNNRRRFK